MAKGRSRRRRHAARNREDRPQHAEEQDEGEPPEEIRHRQRDAIGDVDAGFDRRAALSARREMRERRRRWHSAMTSAKIGEFQRRRQAVEHERQHVLPQRDRGAEIAVQHAGQPDEELLDRSTCRGRRARAAPSMSACVAPGGSIIAIGSPGATRISTKTTTATPNSVMAMVRRRIEEALQDHERHRASQCGRGRAGTAGPQPADQAGEAAARCRLGRGVIVAGVISAAAARPTCAARP